MAIEVDSGKCSGCGSCVSVCPVEAITVVDNKAVVGDECVECGVCIDVCGLQALSLP